MSENSSPPILNPNIYLNYLQPTVASQYEIARNVFLVTLGALIWDILSSLPDDWTLIRTTRPSPVLFAYLTSRTCALAVVFMSVLGRTGPVQDCGVVELILCVSWVFASGSSSYLFLKRVHAIFLQKKLVRHAFTVLWVAGVGTSAVVLPGLLHNHYQIANTKHCTTVGVDDYVSAAFIVPAVFDAFVFFAITYKILMFHHTEKPTNWKAFFSAKSLPHLSRAVLQGGQQYYMITTGVNITRTAVSLSPSVPPNFQLLPSVPAIALTCAMACRVFRNLKLELLQETEVRRNLTTIRFANKERDNVHRHLPTNTDVASAETDLGQC